MAFIKGNNYLVHLDLSNTDLQEYMLKPLLETIQESTSLLSVHLCGNPGVREESFSEFCVEILNATIPHLNIVRNAPASFE